MNHHDQTAVPFGEPVGHEGVRVQVIRTDGSSLSVPIW